MGRERPARDNGMRWKRTARACWEGYCRWDEGLNLAAWTKIVECQVGGVLAKGDPSGLVVDDVPAVGSTDDCLRRRRRFPSDE